MPANHSDCIQEILEDRLPVAGYGYTNFKMFLVTVVVTVNANLVSFEHAEFDTLL